MSDIVFKELIISIKDSVICIVDVITLFIAINTYRELRKNDSSLTENKIIEMLMNAEEKVFEAKINNKPEEQIDAWRERYINVLDIICYKYLSNKIDKDMFKSCFKEVVVNAKMNEEYKSFINANTAKNIEKVYDELIKK